MGKYSLQGSDQFDQRLDNDLQEVVEAVRAIPESSSVQAIVLMGGYGRGEGTPFLQGGMQCPFNDYDLVVVSSPLSTYHRQQLRWRLQQLEQQLSQKLGIAVDLYLHTTNTLQRAEHSLLNYEMRNGHRVLYGAPDILSLMPAYSLDTLPLEEGTRLLLNRGKLLLDMKICLGQQAPFTPAQDILYQKFLWKNHLAFGDCILLAHGEYDLSYDVKKQRIQTYLSRCDIPDAKWIVDRYSKAVDFKHGGDLAVLQLDNLYHAFSDTTRYYLEFLLWYESKRLKTTLPSLQTYVDQLQRQEFDVLTHCKALIRNISLMNVGLFSPQPSWAFIHPRNRLYPALWLFLSFESSMQLDLRLLQQLLHTKGDYSRLLSRFYELRGRLS